MEKILILKITELFQTNGITYRVDEKDKKILFDGTLQYAACKKVFFACQVMIRDHIFQLKNHKYIFWFSETGRTSLNEMESGLLHYQMLLMAFLESLTTGDYNLNTKMLFGAEIQLLMEAHKIISEAANSIIEEINEKHMRNTVVLAVVAIIISLASLFCSIIR